MRGWRCRRGRGPATFALAAAALLLLAGGYLWALGGTPRPSVGGGFALTAGDGRAVTNRDFRGRYLLIYFGYASCRDVCPTTLAAVAEAMDRLGPRAARVQPVFITVDPQRDTPAVVRAYAAQFSDRLVGLTGTDAQIRAAERAFRVTSTIHPDGGAMYAVDHSSVLHLVGPDGRYVAPIAAAQSGTAMAAAISKFAGLSP